MRVFISYRREDSIAVTGRIRDRLAEAFGEQNVYMDVDSIPLGVDFREHLTESIGKCDALLAVIGPNWAGSAPGVASRLDDTADYVRVELEAALRRGVPVVPVLVQGAGQPAPSALPDTIRDLAYRQATPVRHDPDFTPDVRRLIDGLRELDAVRATPIQPEPAAIDPAEGTQPSITIPEPGGHSVQRLVGLGLALAALVAVVVVALLASRSGKEGASPKDNGSTTRSSAPVTSSTTKAQSSTTGGPSSTADAGVRHAVLGEAGARLKLRGYTMKLATDWANKLSGDDDNIYYLPIGVAVDLVPSGPYPANGATLDYIARSSVLGHSGSKVIGTPKTREIDGEKAVTYETQNSYSRTWSTFTLHDGDEYYLELTLFDSAWGEQDRYLSDYKDMLDSITWDK